MPTNRAWIGRVSETARASECWEGCVPHFYPVYTTHKTGLRTGNPLRTGKDRKTVVFSVLLRDKREFGEDGTR